MRWQRSVGFLWVYVWCAGLQLCCQSETALPSNRHLPNYTTFAELRVLFLARSAHAALPRNLLSGQLSHLLFKKLCRADILIDTTVEHGQFCLRVANLSSGASDCRCHCKVAAKTAARLRLSNEHVRRDEKRTPTHWPELSLPTKFDHTGWIINRLALSHLFASTLSQLRFQG